jgi:hypothetical protein
MRSKQQRDFWANLIVRPTAVVIGALFLAGLLLYPVGARGRTVLWGLMLLISCALALALRWIDRDVE